MSQRCIWDPFMPTEYVYWSCIWFAFSGGVIYLKSSINHLIHLIYVSSSLEGLIAAVTIVYPFAIQFRTTGYRISCFWDAVSKTSFVCLIQTRILEYKNTNILDTKILKLFGFPTIKPNAWISSLITEVTLFRVFCLLVCLFISCICYIVSLLYWVKERFSAVFKDTLLTNVKYFL